jgi:hypothetical protein
MICFTPLHAFSAWKRFAPPVVVCLKTCLAGIAIGIILRTGFALLEYFLACYSGRSPYILPPPESSTNPLKIYNNIIPYNAEIINIKREFQ